MRERVTARISEPYPKLCFIHGLMNEVINQERLPITLGSLAMASFQHPLLWGSDTEDAGNKMPGNIRFPVYWRSHWLKTEITFVQQWKQLGITRKGKLHMRIGLSLKPEVIHFYQKAAVRNSVCLTTMACAGVGKLLCFPWAGFQFRPHWRMFAANCAEEKCSKTLPAAVLSQISFLTFSPSPVLSLFGKGQHHV